MDALLRVDVILLSGLSCFCAAVVVEDPSSTMMVVVAEMIAAGLSFSCYCAVTVVVDAEAFANSFHEKGSHSLAPSFSI